MMRTMNKYRLILSIMAVAFLLSPLIMTGVNAQTGDTFAEGLTLHHSFENSTILINTFYSTDYTDGKWKITDNKNVNIVLNVTTKPENTTIFVEHMHADCVIFSNESQEINGLSQDSMDDSMNVGEQPGFYVSPKYEYNCIFAIEGYSQVLIDGWGFMVGQYGAMDINQNRLTEDNLVREGAKGSEFMIVFDLLIKNGDEEFYHTISFMDDFVVYFNGMFEENPGGILDPIPPEPFVWTNETTLIFFFSIIAAGIIVIIIVGAARWRMNW